MSLHTSTRRAILRLERVVKTYTMGAVQVFALRGVDLDLLDGELLVLLGPSGSDKSSLLNILGGLDTPTSGRVWFREQEVGRIGNPLASISSLVQELKSLTMESYEDKEFSSESLKTINSHIERIAKIVRSLGDFARISTKEKIATNISEILDRTIKLVRLTRGSRIYILFLISITSLPSE